MRRRRVATALAVSGLLLAACGGSSDEPAARETVGSESTAATDAPSDTTSAPTDPTTTIGNQTTEPSTTETSTTEPSTTEPSTTAPPTTESQDDASTDDTEPPPEASPDTTAAATTAAPTTTEPAPPDDGCSLDGAPTGLEVADAPPPDLAVQPESASSPFPPLAVRRLNCDGGWVQLANESPSDLPVLAWVWAPH